jgi:hypothetical protein
MNETLYICLCVYFTLSGECKGQIAKGKGQIAKYKGAKGNWQIANSK